MFGLERCRPKDQGGISKNLYLFCSYKVHIGHLMIKPTETSLVVMYSSILHFVALTAEFQAVLFHANAQTTFPITKIYQFEPGDWVESLAFRPNGQLLVNLLSSPDVYQIDTGSGSMTHVTSIPEFSGLYGLTEAAPDQFYIAGGRFILSNSTHYHGSYSVWHLDMTTFDTESATTSKVAEFPLAGLNGLTTLDADRGLILVADTDGGYVYTLNVYTGTSSITVDDAVLKTPPTATIKLNVNGINVRHGDLYFTNTAAGTFGRVPIDSEGVQTGPGVVLARTPEGNGGDDWTFDDEGNAYVADDPYNWVNLIRKGSIVTEIIAGGPNSTAILGPTAAKFGPSALDRSRQSLYVSTSGGIGQYQTGKFTVGGGIYRIDMASPAS